MSKDILGDNFIEIMESQGFKFIDVELQVDKDINDNSDKKFKRKSSHQIISKKSNLSKDDKIKGI